MARELSGYTENRHYCPVRDLDVVRISMWDRHGQEFFKIIPRENGKRWRERRTAALDDICDAIEGSREPGEVT